MKFGARDLRGTQRGVAKSYGMYPNDSANGSRREMLKTVGLGAAALGLGSVLSSPALGASSGLTGATKRNPWIYAFNIGDLQAWSISDGFMKFRKGLEMMYPESERESMKEMLIDNFEPTDFLPLYVNVLVVKSDSEVMLFDAGFGIVKNADRGWLREGLKEIGIAPRDVTAAFLSHAHGDHINGFVNPDGGLMFPNAVIYTTPEEFKFWRQKEHDFSKSRRNPRAIPGLIKNAQKQFEILKPQIETAAVGKKVLGGTVEVVDGFGHTPGHGLFRISSAGESLLHIMDIVHSHLLMFRDPAWSIGLDHTPELAVETRRRVFSMAARDRTPCYGFHVPWPGIGGIAKQGSGYAWVPARNWWMETPKG
ncbi:MAG: MBL fold metallo-hydrolase [Verrucomicrobiota bacterium]